MERELRENKHHGTAAYPYCQYRCTGLYQPFQYPIHWHNELEIIYVRKGTLQVNIGGRDYSGRPGSVFLVNPQQLHLMGSADLSVYYYILLFPLEFISFQSVDDLEREVMLPLRTGQRSLPTEVTAPTAEMYAALDRIIDINGEKSACCQLETRILLLRFLMEILRKQPLLSPAVEARSQLQKQILEYIRGHYWEKLTLTDLAERFHLSPKYLSRYFKENFRLNLSQYIAHLRMVHAQRLLETTELPVEEIAMRSGFSSASFFIRCFKKTHDVSPLQYRCRLRQPEA